VRLRRLPAGVVVALVILAAVAADVGLQQVLAGPGPVSAEHEWPAEASGRVWVVVDPPDGRRRTITLQWGPWQQRVHLGGGDPVAYALTKEGNPRAGSVGIRVTVDPGAEVSFGVGPPPAGLPVVDLDGGWRRTGPLP